MALKTFRAYSRLLRFDDSETRASSPRRADKLAPIRDVWDAWARRLPLLYRPGPEVTDERMVPFRGRCPFQYMPNKPARYGIKLWVTCDAKSSYAWKMQVYTGKAEEKEKKARGREGGRPNLSAQVVLDLTEGLGPGRNVTCDNFFTSHELTCTERGLTVLGTLRANKPEIPRELLRVKGRALRSSLFAFAEATESSPAAVAVSYLAKKAKNVLILSTAEAHVRGAAVSERADHKPLAVLDYNRTKGGVDNLDKVLATYSCRRKTSRWPLALFHNIVDVSAYNAFVIRRELEPVWLLGKLHRRRVFLERLGRALASPLICRRERVPREPLSAAVVLSVRRRA